MATSNSSFTRTFRDLKRRRVFRVAAAYGVLAWVLVEVSSVVAPALLLPDWTERLVIYLVLLGLPIALILAWAYDLTPDGVVRTGPASDEELASAGAASGRRIDFVVIAVLIGIIAWQFYSPGNDSERGPDLQSIAVLPFVDLSEFQNSEYFSDGMAEELLNALVHVEGLRVAARTSSFAFKGQNTDVRDIGRELNVDTVLEGSVRRSGDQVRITAQLINVDDGFHLWSGTFNRTMDDVFEIQNDIAEQIVAALQLELGGSKATLLARAPTTDIRAYDLYLEGRHNWHRRTSESLERALDLFEQAVAIDADFALAYTGIADTYLLLEEYAGLDHSKATQNAEASVAHALALDDQLAEAYASLGLLRLSVGDLTAAELALRKAINLNPKYSMAHMWLGLVLRQQSELRAAYHEFDIAGELDPLHPVVNQNLADALGNMGRFDDAYARIEKVIEQQPESGRGYFLLAKLAFRYGRFDQTIQLIEKAAESEEYAKYANAYAGMTYAALGDFDRARALIEQVRNESPDEIDLANMAAYAYFMMGDMQALGEVAELSLADIEDWRTADLNAHARRSLIWPGVARVMQDQFDDGAEMLERALLGDEPFGPDPADLVFLYGCLAYAYQQTGRDDAAEQLWQRSLVELSEAGQDGWANPDFAAARALVYLAQDRDEEAVAALNDALTSGWRHYWMGVNMPFIRDHLDEPAVQTVMNAILSDLDIMRARLDEGADNSPSARLYESDDAQNRHRGRG